MTPSQDTNIVYFSQWIIDEPKYKANGNKIIQTFRRYNYTVLSKHVEDAYLEDLKDRSNYLQKYLNI